MGQNFKTIDVARLEVAVPPTGLVNLVPNPDGELGAWGWTTSNASATLERDPLGTEPVLSYKNTVGLSWFETTPMPMTAGYYAAASIVLPDGPANTPITMRFEWLDAAQASIGFSAVTGSMSARGTYALGPQQAPANTRFMKLTFDMANPGSTRLNGVRVASAATSGALGSSITNMIPNPSAEVDLYGWEAWRGSITRDTTVTGVAGSAVIRAADVSASGIMVGTPEASGMWHPVTPGRDYVFAYSARAATTGRRMDGVVRWYSGAAMLYETRLFGDVSDTAGSWQREAYLFTAPNGATHARFFALFNFPGLNEVHYLDAFTLTEGSTVPAYFDGSSIASGTISYTWQGTPHASASIMTDSTLGSIAPDQWRNVLGPTHSIKIVRESLNVGTLEADVLDSSIDPATSALVRPGGKVRALALVDGKWEPLFTGTLDKIDVEYEVKSRPVKPPRVRLVGHDNTTGLSGLSRPSGVAKVSELFDVIEGANVPWSINGYSGLPNGSAAPVVSTNDKATALDQVALTRDTALGHAWVSRRGVLVAHDTPADGNLLPNGTFDTNTTGWTAGASTTLARVTTPTRTGAGALSLTRTGTTGTASAITTNPGSPPTTFPVVGGRTYTLAWSSRAAATPRSVTLAVSWFDANGQALGGGVSSSTNTNAVGSWTTTTQDMVAFPKAAFARVEIQVPSAAVNEVHYFDDLSLAARASDVTYAEARYSDLSLAFASTACINAVEVDVISIDADGKPLTTTYGPYEDAVSINAWGRRLRRFTVHGLAASAVPAYAARILGRNATPGVSVSQVRMPMRTTADLADTVRDLGDLVRVTNAAKAIDATMRVTRVEHSIEAEPAKWMLTLGFASSGSVAAPTLAPPLVREPPPKPPATAAGTVFQATPVASMNITYPPGRFTTYPMVTVTCTPTTNVALVGLVSNNTKDGCTVFLYGIGGTWTNGALSIYWHASESH